MNRLRVWVAIGAVSPSWMACRKNTEQWLRIEQLPQFYEFPDSVKRDIDRWIDQIPSRWQDEPASEKQLQRLRFFEIPFVEQNLTKHQASLLIDAFAAIDPERQAEYENRPCSDEQRKRMAALGGNAEGMTYAEARRETQSLEFEAETERREQENEMIEFMMFENSINDPEVLELCGYKKWTEQEARDLLIALDARRYPWREMSRFDLGDYLAKLQKLMDADKKTRRLVGSPKNPVAGVSNPHSGFKWILELPDGNISEIFVPPRSRYERNATGDQKDFLYKRGVCEETLEKLGREQADAMILHWRQTEIVWGS